MTVPVRDLMVHPYGMGNRDTTVPRSPQSDYHRGGSSPPRLPERSLSMPITVEQKKEYLQTLQGLSEICPATKHLAHDIRNHLQVIMCNVEMINKAETPDQTLTYQARIQDSADSIAKLLSEVGL